MKTLAQQVQDYMSWRAASSGKSYGATALARDVATHQRDLPEEERCKRQNIAQLLEREIAAPRYIAALAAAMNTTVETLMAGAFVPTGRRVARVSGVYAENTQQIDGQAGRVPLISWVAAGNWSNIENPYEIGDAEDWLVCPVRHGPRTYALRVVGLSMFDPTGERSFKDGDFIFVDPDRGYENKSLVVVQLDDDSTATFKRLLIDGNDKMLEALNPSWPNRIIRINGRASICGVVISKMESFI